MPDSVRVIHPSPDTDVAGCAPAAPAARAADDPDITAETPQISPDPVPVVRGDGPVAGIPRRQRLAPWSPDLPPVPAAPDSAADGTTSEHPPTPAQGSPAVPAARTAGDPESGRAARRVAALAVAVLAAYAATLALALAGVVSVDWLAPGVGGSDDGGSVTETGPGGGPSAWQPDGPTGDTSGAEATDAVPPDASTTPGAASDATTGPTGGEDAPAGTTPPSSVPTTTRPPSTTTTAPTTTTTTPSTTTTTADSRPGRGNGGEPPGHR